MSFINKVLIGGLAILVSTEIVEHKMVQYDTNTLEPIDRVSVVLPTFNEEEFVQTSLSSLRNQSIVNAYPEMFEFLLIDSGSTDDTVALAKPFVDKIIETNVRGKLTARNLAANYTNGNIIVAIDGDTWYPYYWMNTLLEPLNNYTNPNYKNVIATYGSTFDYTANPIPGPIFSLGDFVYSSFLNRTRMTGRNSAYFKDKYYLVGGFNENINQLKIWDIFNEEEKLFGNRLTKFGKIVYKINASCYHLGGAKSAGRLGIGNRQNLEKYKFGEDRF